MSSNAFDGFMDFIKSSPPIFFTGPEAIINEASKQTYVLSKFLRGRDMSELVQGGPRVKDVIMFDDGSTARQTKPGVTHTWQNPQVLEEWSVGWTFTIDYLVWNRYEIINNNYSSLSVSAKRSLFKKIQYQKEMRLMSSMLNHMEDVLWRKPNYAEMEAQTADSIYPYSIPALVNEFKNGVAWSESSKVMGIDAGVESRWRPYISGYDYADFMDLDGDGDGLIDAIGSAFDMIRFSPPDPSKARYFDQDTMKFQHIFTSQNGIRLYRRALTAINDRTVAGPQDPSYGSPVYNGVPIEHIAALNTAEIYPAAANDLPSGGFADENNASKVGPRFFLLNGNRLKTFYHSEDYFERSEPMTNPSQPDTRIQVVSTSWQLISTSRRRHAIVRPAAVA